MTIRIAIQGELGSFSHEAALLMGQAPGATLELVPCALSSEVFERLANEDVDAAVVPIENSLAGPVAEHYDLLLQHRVAIVSELRLRIRHNLIAAQGAKMEELTEVYSHPVALAQCRKFFASHPRLKAVPYYDTAGAVKFAMEQAGNRIAGIASAQAAEVYGGEVLAAGIEDSEENYTRFHLLRRVGEHGAVGAEGEADKMSLAFSVAHRPGTLVKALELLARCGVDLTKIDSRPVPGKPWEYVFFVDVRFASLEMADRSLAALRGECLMVKDLGRYRAA